ncbi:META domain-containing protein [Herbiconiux sp. YIM B11900]|uniref:META domain-containing protein n=1 Tax=Herbiconiux sp. YIM B11900 TaxID=3404131 RepID=UPI003F85F446
MSSRRLVPFLALSIALVGLAGCASGQAGGPGEGGDDGGSTGASAAVDPAAVGTWRAADPDTAWLRIDDAGAVTGSDGCNKVTGTAAVDGDTIEFTMGLMTQKACSGVTLSFGTLTSGQLSGDVLTARDRDGADLVELHRSAE